MQMGKVFFNPRPVDRGWFYQIDLETPVGPYATKREAVQAAQAFAKIKID